MSVNHLADAVLTRTPSVPKSSKIPHPHLFSGDKKDFDLWRDAILMKLNVDNDHFTTEQSKMAYIYSRLKPSSQSHPHTWVRNCQVLFASAEEMFKTLTTIFEDLNCSRDAVSRLHKNFQRNKPFAQWLAEIRRDASIADYQFYSRNLRDLVIENMYLQLKKSLIDERDVDMLGLNDMVSRLQDIDNRQRAFETALS